MIWTTHFIEISQDVSLKESFTCHDKAHHPILQQKEQVRAVRPTILSSNVSEFHKHRPVWHYITFQASQKYKQRRWFWKHADGSWGCKLQAA